MIKKTKTTTTSASTGRENPQENSHFAATNHESPRQDEDARMPIALLRDDEVPAVDDDVPLPRDENVPLPPSTQDESATMPVAQLVHEAEEEEQLELNAQSLAERVQNTGSTTAGGTATCHTSYYSRQPGR